MGAFRIEWDAGPWARLVFDHPERPVNVLDEAALGDLEAALGELAGRADVKGVVLESGKPGSFAAGADVNAIAAVGDREEALRLVRRAHQAFDRLAALRVPTVAAIDGACLGGGLELALACDARLAAEEGETRLAFPEINLGIFPGFGGSQRLPRLVGLSAALDLMLSGRAVDARRAERMGLVDRAVPRAWLRERAAELLQRLGTRPPGRRRARFRPRGLAGWLLDANPAGRSLVLQRARREALARTRGNYPAPLALLEVVQHGQSTPLAEGLRFEAERVADLVVTPECKSLVRLFQLSERARKDPAGVDPQARPRPVERLGVVGAGVMGGGIAELASRQGIRVRVRDIKAEALGLALATARARVDEAGRRRGRPARERDAQMACILPTLELTGFGLADCVIEAVVEDLDLKRKVFAELEVRVPPTALLATNTSSLSVTELAAGLAHPERAVGFHFFNPVHRMPLVEVVRTPRTADWALLTALALARKLGKTPVVVNDAPGFVVNRILMGYLREAMHLLEEGFAMPAIDRSMRFFGMPMGPFELLDEVGLDVARKVAAVLVRAFPERMSPSPILDRLVEKGRLGRKNGLGFYRHRGARRVPDPQARHVAGLARERPAPPLEHLAEPMVLAMINEAAHCLDAGVVADAGEVDLAMVMGTGFPPFRGGLLRYADTLGVGKIEARLNALRAQRGERFRPAGMLSRLVREGASFTGPVRS
jgi:3-hydroxyacyl-CoA dehydrogenase/enoyl-CoA hydratase/3-hydroxybutyryl-CoA epimerase